MPTLTRTDTADFKALTNCSVVAGSVVPAYWNFSTDDTGTGDDDWDANCDVSTNAGYCTISNSTTSSFKKAFCDASVESDFLLECAVDVTAFQGHTDQFGIIVEDGSGNIVICNLWRRDDSTWDVRLYTSGGTDVLVATDVGQDNGYLQLEKSGSTWTGRWGTDGSTFPSSNTATYAISGLSVGLFSYRSNQGAAGPATARFDYFSIESGFGGTAEFEMDQFDAGLGNKIDWSTATDSSTGTPTIDYQYDQDGTDGFTPTYNGTWLTLAQLQALTDTLNRYTRIMGQLSSADSGDSFDAFTIDSAVADAIDPDLPTLSAAYYADGDSTKAVIIQITHGDDNGAAGTYEGVNISYRNGGTWYYEQSDGTFDTDETFANLGFCGSANTVEWCALDGLPAAADRIGVKAWDSAGNSSARAESTPALLDFPDVGNVTTDDTVGGANGTFAVPAEADVESGVSYGAGGTEYTGTLVAGGGLPSVPTVTVVDNADGTVTLSVTGADAGTTNTLKRQAAGASTWNTLGTVTGNDESTVAVDPGWHWFAVESANGDGAVTSAIVAGWVIDPDGAYDCSEIRTWLRGRLTASSALTSRLDSTDNIRATHSVSDAAAPGVLIDCAWSPDADGSDDGPFTVKAALSLLARCHADLDAMTAAIRDTLSDWPFATASWEIRRVTITADRTDAERVRNDGGEPLLARDLTVTLRVNDKSTVAFTKDAEHLTLPAPRPGAETDTARRQSTALTADGTRYVYDASLRDDRFTLAFGSLTAAEAGALETFFHNRAGQQETFTYTDADGTDTTVRFADPTLRITRHASGCRDAEVGLRSRQ